jgi:single-strand DNA-binding protein
MSLNKVALIGNCCKDPDIRSTQDGRELANFSLATSERWKAKDGTKQEKTEFHKIVVFSSGLVGVVKNYVKKGSKLYIEGQLQTRKWTDKDGVEKFTTEIILQNFNSNLILLDSKSKPESKDNPKFEQMHNDFTATKESESFDEIPF